MATVKLRVYLLPGNIQHSQVEVFGKELSYSVRGIEYFNVVKYSVLNNYVYCINNRTLYYIFLGRT